MRWPFAGIKSQESELDREVRHHLEMLTEEYERKGMNRHEAMLQARKEFGGVEHFKEQCRDERRWRPLAQLAQDIQFGFRMLRKTPAVTVTAVLSLALGIGATTAIVSIVDAVLWRQLGVPEPEQLSEILWQAKTHPQGIYRSTSGSSFLEEGIRVSDFFSYAATENMRAFANVAGHLNTDDVSTSFQGKTAVAKLRPVTGNFFRVLRLQPALGRVLMDSDEQPGSAMTVVVTHTFWQNHLNSDPAIVGRGIRINNQMYTIAGVLPRRFEGIKTGDSTDLYTTFPHSPDVLAPGSFYADGKSNPLKWYIQLIGRRDAGMSSEAFGRMLEPRFRSTWTTQPTNGPEGTPSLRVHDAGGGLGGLRREMGNPVKVLLSLVGLVLLMACANIANLLLARADARREGSGAPHFARL